ncbi:MAG: dihydroorotate dehydrogenase (quinone) [Betaproteobacteria bacterium RIFCSPLOWO2_02_FULL_62_17]|nr:MAG: dihydroorotate dehydrogenase (quinone) [Betaproteobacteria bacterium RIFCSPLOWO2_02_FULL_62_17]
MRFHPLQSANPSVNLYRKLVRPILFQCDPEWTHHTTLAIGGLLGRSKLALKALQALYGFDDPRLHTTVAGLRFPNPVCLPAGFDKSAHAVDAIAAVGFGAVEVGSVSAHPSAGNPERPRLFRVPDDEALMVYYGVPNDGAQVVAQRLAETRLPVPLGINIVETNTGKPLDGAQLVAELTQALCILKPLASYITVNMNCPNSAGGLSPLDEPATLRRLLESFAACGEMPPLFLKIRMNPEPAAIDAVLAVTDAFAFVKGFVPSVGSKRPYVGLNTPQAVLDRMPGSLSGPFTREGATRVMRAWYARIDPQRYALLGAGGIVTAEHAYERIRAGASLVQVYGAMIYNGPGVIKRIKAGLCTLLARDGLADISQAIGADAKV